MEEEEENTMLPLTSAIGGTKAKRARVAKVIAAPRWACTAVFLLGMDRQEFESGRKVSLLQQWFDET